MHPSGLQSCQPRAPLVWIGLYCSFFHFQLLSAHVQPGGCVLSPARLETPSPLIEAPNTFFANASHSSSVIIVSGVHLPYSRVPPHGSFAAGLPPHVTVPSLHVSFARFLQPSRVTARVAVTPPK